MQSGYGFSENQQFVVDGGYSPLFSISTADIHGCSHPQRHHHDAHEFQHQPQPQQQQQRHHHNQQVQRPQHQQHQLHLYHHYPQLYAQQVVPHLQPFQHFPAIPITPHLFQQTHQLHQFRQEQQRRMHEHQLHLGLDQEPGAMISCSLPPVTAAAACGAGGGGGGLPPFLGPFNFTLAMNNGGGGRSHDGMKDEDVLQGDEASSRIYPCIAGEEGAASKEPFWRALDVNYINRNNKRCNEKGMELSDDAQPVKLGRKGYNAANGNNTARNYKLFSELEAIYMPGSSGRDGGDDESGFGGGESNQPTASASALTGENRPTVGVSLGHDGDLQMDTTDQASNASTAKEAARATRSSKSRGSSKKRKRKRQLSSIATFLESLVKKLMDHQEGLHRKFLKVLERRDQERMDREEMWRQQEASKASREAMARAEEQALASNREAAIISFLEKATGERLNLPTRTHLQSLQQQLEESTLKEGSKPEDNAEADTAATAGDGCNTDGNTTTTVNEGLASTSRWPKAEVQTLIRERSGLELKLQEPGMKGPLWEEVSSAMASMGYNRSAKRCKEKWENINKYFRKSKNSAKKSYRRTKSCPYFEQLDQLYSTSLSTAPASANPPSATHPRRGEVPRIISMMLSSSLTSPSAAGEDEGREEEEIARIRPSNSKAASDGRSTTT